MDDEFYSSFQKYVPIKWRIITVSVSRRMISFSSGSCLSKLERIKANRIEVIKIIGNYHIPQCNFNTLPLFAFTRFYLRVLADENEIILRLKQKCYSEKNYNSLIEYKAKDIPKIVAEDNMN